MYRLVLPVTSRPFQSVLTAPHIAGNLSGIAGFREKEALQRMHAIRRTNPEPEAIVCF